MADGQQPVLLASDPAHLLAFGHRMGHQLLGEDVLARLHRLDGHRRVQPQGQRDDDHLDVRVGEHLLLGLVLLQLLDVGRSVLLVVGEFLDRAFLLGGANVAAADEVEVIAIVIADQGLAAFVAGADDRGLDRGLVPHFLVAEIEAGQG